MVGNILGGNLFLRIGVTRADLKHYGKMPYAREELNRSVRERIIESGHSIMSLEGMGHVHMS